VELQGRRTDQRPGQGNTAEDRRPWLDVHGPCGHRHHRERGRPRGQSAAGPDTADELAIGYRQPGAQPRVLRREPGRNHRQHNAAAGGRARRGRVRNGTGTTATAVWRCHQVRTGGREEVRTAPEGDHQRDLRLGRRRGHRRRITRQADCRPGERQDRVRRTLGGRGRGQSRALRRRRRGQGRTDRGSRHRQGPELRQLRSKQGRLGRERCPERHRGPRRQGVVVLEVTRRLPSLPAPTSLERSNIAVVTRSSLYSDARRDPIQLQLVWL